MINNDLYLRTVEGLLLKCIDDEQAQVAVGEVHEELCVAHQATHKMKWVLRRASLYWPTMMKDYIWYKKGCEACKNFGDIQMVPASMLHHVIKPWTFRGWGLCWRNTSIIFQRAPVCLGGY
jgi:hypothetical protein